MDSLNGIDKPIYSKILCCLCGTSIEPNAAAMCIDCLRTQYDITTDIEHIEIIDSFDKSNDKSKIENSSIINDKSNSSKVASLGILAEAVIMREADLGDNDNSFRILTHLGHILQPGDIAAGYDLRHSAANEDLLDTLTFAYPDVILVKKVYSDPISSKKKKSSKRRNRRDRVVNKEVSDEVNDDNNNNNNTDVDIIVNYYDESDDEDDDDDEVLFPPLPPESKDE
eukprot:gene19282-25140_t